MPRKSTTATTPSRPPSSGISLNLTRAPSSSSSSSTAATKTTTTNPPTKKAKLSLAAPSTTTTTTTATAPTPASTTNLKGDDASSLTKGSHSASNSSGTAPTAATGTPADAGKPATSSVPTLILNAPSTTASQAPAGTSTKAPLPWLPPEYKVRKWQRSAAQIKLLSGGALKVRTWHSDTPRQLSKEMLGVLDPTVTSVIGMTTEEAAATPKLRATKNGDGDDASRQERGITPVGLAPPAADGPTRSSTPVLDAAHYNQQFPHHHLNADGPRDLPSTGGDGTPQQIGYTNDDMAYATFVEGRGVMFKCDRIGCHKEFTKVESLRKHISLAHPDSQPCVACGRRFASHRKLVKHMRTLHNLYYDESGTLKDVPAASPEAAFST